MGDQLRQLGTLAGMVGSAKGSLKFSLEHSLTYVYVLNNIVIESKLIESKVTDRCKLDEINLLAAINYDNFFRKAKSVVFSNIFSQILCYF